MHATLPPPPTTLLGVWAHPDDEAYLSAGLMARTVRAGGRVVVVTATAGEAGTDDPRTWPPDRLGAARLAELRRSLAVLGVHEVHHLGLPDGRCAEFDATDAIASIVGAVRPEVIVTFGPDGLTGHADHRAVSRWATAARDRASAGTDLWYATVTPEFHRRWAGPNAAARFFYPGQPDRPATPVAELVHHGRLPDELVDLKVVALAAHATQTAAVIERVGLSTYREWWREECFRAADGVAVERSGRPRDQAAA